MPNFVKIGQSVAEILHFFDFSKFPLPPCWIFEIAKFYLITGSRGPRCIIVPNFVKIGQTVTKTSHFSFLDISRLCYDLSVRLSVCPSACDVCALWSQGAMDPRYLCMLG